jgi:hypothetical protein
MIISPGGSTTVLPVAPAIKDLINGIRGAGQNEDYASSTEYTAEALQKLANFAQQQAALNAVPSATPAPPSTPPYRMVVPFWFGQGENQPASPTQDLNLYELVFPNDPPVVYTTAIWQFADIYNYNSPAPTTDLLIELYLNGVALFDTNHIKLPSGTAVETIITATNFANPTSAITERVAITGRILQTDANIMNIQVNLVFDLVSQ